MITNSFDTWGKAAEALVIALPNYKQTGRQTDKQTGKPADRHK